MGHCYFGQSLTDIEKRTMVQLCEGMTPKRIARIDGVKPNAIRTRMWRVGIKLGTRGHIQTIMTAYRRGLFELPELIHTACGE